MIIDYTIKTIDLQLTLDRFCDFSGKKIISIEKEYDTSMGAPVFTNNGKYSTIGWTEWTQGFQYGSAILQFDATDEKEFYNLGRKKTIQLMAPHISHIGVHDHGFNNLSTYGNLLRIVTEGKAVANNEEIEFYKLALKISGAVQASRWTNTKDGGFIYSFNGPHSLFVDTIRSCRILMVSHMLNHTLFGEGDEKINLLERALKHIESTAKYSIYYGEGRDSYDVCGRTAHESIFNSNDGNFRCPNSQQGYSGFTTWTRGLAWAMVGFAEELEFINSIESPVFELFDGKEAIISMLLKGAKATCDFFIENTPLDGVPYWDTGAPNLHKLGNYIDEKSNPFNNYEPIDSSAAAIGVQGLLRLGKFLGNSDDGIRYWQAGLTVLKSLLNEPYLSVDDSHQGLLLHSIYHRPNGWDYIPNGSRIPYGESSMWGDYHMREVALYVTKQIKKEKYYTFFGCV